MYSALREALSPFKPYIIFCLFRTWSNGWTTSYRMHEQYRRPCILGCPDGSDELAHYICCNRFWKALKTALAKAFFPVSSFLASTAVLEKLAIASPSPEHVLHLCSITHAYHVLKHNYRHIFHTYIQQGNVEQVANITIDVLKAALIRFHAMI